MDLSDINSVKPPRIRGDITRRFRISGRVQGVGYRFFAQRAARELGLSGWVRNLADGCVECHASGSVQDLEAFEVRLRKGPRLAEVSSVEVQEAAADGDSSGFHIH